MGGKGCLGKKVGGWGKRIGGEGDEIWRIMIRVNIMRKSERLWDMGRGREG